ncbi:MAG: ribose 5-phosphate isomerase A [Acidilobus sp.]
MSCDPKDLAAEGAIEILRDVLKGRGLVGIGAGTTVRAFVRRAADLLKPHRVVSASSSTSMELSALGVDVISYPSTRPVLEAYVDGADEVTLTGDMVKGRGGALLGEKILSYFSRLNIYIVGDDKLVSKLGEKGPIPIEVVPHAYPFVMEALRSLGLKAYPRQSQGKLGPLVSDWGGFIVDVETGPLEDPAAFDRLLRGMPGVVETGIFLGYADYVVVGRAKDCRYEIYRFRRTAKAPHI